MQYLSLFSQISLYVLLTLVGLLALIIWGWQIHVLRGKAMKNADGTTDDWHEQKMFYGIALADIFLACPASIIAIVLLFISPRWGFFLLAWISCWFVWANIMTTATSLRFEKPKFTLMWFIQFPLGTLVGLATMVWIVVHFETVFFV